MQDSSLNSLFSASEPILNRCPRCGSCPILHFEWENGKFEGTIYCGARACGISTSKTGWFLAKEEWNSGHATHLHLVH
jgi:hypothetical protein